MDAIRLGMAMVAENADDRHDDQELDERESLVLRGRFSSCCAPARTDCLRNINPRTTPGGRHRPIALWKIGQASADRPDALTLIVENSALLRHSGGNAARAPRVRMSMGAASKPDAKARDRTVTPKRSERSPVSFGTGRQPEIPLLVSLVRLTQVTDPVERDS